MGGADPRAMPAVMPEAANWRSNSAPMRDFGLCSIRAATPASVSDAVQSIHSQQSKQLDVWIDTPDLSERVFSIGFNHGMGELRFTRVFIIIILVY